MSYKIEKMIKTLGEAPVTGASCEAIALASTVESHYERLLVYLGRRGFEKNEVESGTYAYLAGVYARAMKGESVYCPNCFESLAAAVRRNIIRHEDVYARVA